VKNKLTEKFSDIADATLREAAASFKKRDYPKCAELAFTSLRAMAEDDGRHEKAEKMLRDVAGKDKVAGNKILGEYYLFQARYEDALTTFSEAISASPDGKARANLFMKCAATVMAGALDGPRHKKREQLERAEEYCHAAIDNGGNHRQIYFFLMYVQGMKNDQENSRSYARKILRDGADDDLASMARQHLRCTNSTPLPIATIWAKPLPLLN
jgi:tetratricopeptide (TPR) repeat protein